MPLVEIILGLLIIVAILAWVSARVRVPYPMMLVLGGLGLSFVPNLLATIGNWFGWNWSGPPPVQLHPDIVFILFLPPILYYAGLQTSWRDFRRHIRPISTLAFGLVLLTMVVVALTAHWLIPAMPLAAAFVLGAVISPPDSVAPAAILERLRVPRRVTTILEGESAVNDATALVAYQFAIAAVVTGQFSLMKASGDFIVVAIGGIAVGYAAGRVMMWIRPRLRDAAIDSVLSLLTPYVAYLPAEWLHVSGVLAAVTAGFVVSRRTPLVLTSRIRMRAYANWETFIFLLNGLVFILIGLQLPAVMQGLSGYSWAQLIGYSVAISVVAIAVRLMWVFTATYVSRWLIPPLRQLDPAPPWTQVFLIGWTGLRGIVSLAAALALPIATQTGEEFPGRHLILFITFGVILATLVLQGLTLPAVIRALGLTPDTSDAAEERQARLEGAHAALARLEALAFTNEELAALITRVRLPYEERIQLLGGRNEGVGEPSADQAMVCTSIVDVQREALRAERRWVVRLRDEGVIGDDVFRKVQQDLDLEESKLG